jgi:hypothetical protein
MSGKVLRENKQAFKMVVSNANKELLAHQQLLQNHKAAVDYQGKALHAIQGPFNQNNSYSVQTLYTHVDNILNGKNVPVDETGWSDADKTQFYQDVQTLLEQNKITAGWNAYRAYKQSSETIKQIEAMPEFNGAAILTSLSNNNNNTKK